jgi:hypothetical protein
MARTAALTVHQLKITLHESKPPIWRRIQISSSDTLDTLHYSIQASMGWSNSHLHEFETEMGRYSKPSFELDDYGDDVGDEARVLIKSALPREGSRCGYVYDFGDDWQHLVEVEKILAVEEGVNYPRCIKAVRACPPDDVGGVWGFQEFCEIMANPKHKEHKSMKEWYGGPFDPVAVDLDTINERLDAVRKGTSIYQMFE